MDHISEESSFADLLTEFEQSHHAVEPGSQALQGTVISVSADTAYLDIGRKMEGALPVEQLRDRSGSLTIKPGDTLVVNVTGRNEEGYYTLSRARVARPKDWTALEKAFNEKLTVAGVVAEAVKGGLRVDLGARAFLPASRSGARDQAELEKLIGQEIQCRIIKLDIADEDVVVDRRVVLEEQAAQARNRAFSELSEGMVLRGTVRSLTDFGAFVDIGGVDGLLHVGEMSWHRVEKPSDIVSPGDSIEVKIIKITPETQKVSLSLKQLQPHPWDLAAEKYKVGDRVRGKVVRVADYGAFVELEPGVDGLIHVSELSWSKKQRKPSDIVKTGELVEVVVLGVNPAEHRISLTLKQALGDPWEEAEKKYLPGSVVEGPVVNLTKFGAFVDLGNGIEGMIHIGDISREKRLDHPRQALNAGQTVKAQVLEVDREKRRIRLGMKQLEPTSADEYLNEHKAGEVVSGRVVEVTGNKARVELGEGVIASCKIGAEPQPKASAPAASGADISTLTAMLSARWKEGKSNSASSESIRPGQIRSFRIAGLDPAQKRIDIELA
jgi:small subunit ribosomal protein S1